MFELIFYFLNNKITWIITLFENHNEMSTTTKNANANYDKKRDRAKNDRGENI